MNFEAKTSGEHSLSKEEYRKVLEAVEHPEDKLLIMLAVNTGLRRIDVVNVKIKHINLKDQEITYYEHKKDRWRTIPINKRLTQELQLYLNVLPKNRECLFSFNDRTAYNRFNRLLDKAGVPGPRPFHCLRATCYKFCQEAGMSPEAAAKLLGDSLRVAQMHYGTPTKNDLREGVEGLEGVRKITMGEGKMDDATNDKILATTGIVVTIISMSALGLYSIHNNIWDGVVISLGIIFSLQVLLTLTWVFLKILEGDD